MSLHCDKQISTWATDYERGNGVDMPTRKDLASYKDGAVGTLEPDEPRAQTHFGGADAQGPARATVMPEAAPTR